jgi:hypothetical protein
MKMPRPLDHNAKRNRLRRVKSGLTVSSSPSAGTRSTELISPKNAKRIARILLKSPRDDYDSIQQLDQCVLAKHKTQYFKVVNIKQLDCADVLELSQTLFTLQHVNIASLYDIYRSEDQAFLVSEHLHICISQLGMQDDLWEWEIATIFSEVLVASTLMDSSDGHRCSKALRILPRSSYLARTSQGSTFDCPWMER